MRLKYREMEELVEQGNRNIIIWFDITGVQPWEPDTYRYSVPVDVFEHRLAEYGDLTEEQLMEMVIAEGAMILGVGETNDGLTTLDSASSRSEARRDHLARCARVKLKYRISTMSGDRKLRDDLREKIKVNEDSMKEKRRQFRAALRRGRDWED